MRPRVDAENKRSAGVPDGGMMDECRKALRKAEVRRYWQAKPCNTDYSAKPEGTIEWSDEIEENRYALEPFIHAFAQFTRWRGKKVLEVGCGVGTDCLQFARAGADMHAVDLTEKGVEITRRRLALNGLSADVRVGDAEALPFEDNLFDLVYSWGVLHHSPDTEKAVSEAHRVLKPKGRFVIMLYNRRSIIAGRLYLHYGLKAGRPFRTFRDILASHMESAGTKAFTVSELRQMFSRFDRQHISPVLTAGDIERFPKWLHRWLPPAWGWFAVISGFK